GQLADQRSGTLVAERPDEHLAPKTPIFRALALYIAIRSRIDAGRSSKMFSIKFQFDPRKRGQASAIRRTILPLGG
ncbi:MAG TPA: hypothetical protein VF237_09215, partial [Xanthobacteraceae bacterium]